MATLARHPDFDVPVLSSETSVAWTGAEIRQFAMSTPVGETFVRRAFLSPLGYDFDNLKRVLRVARDAIDRTCDLFEAGHIPYSFALYDGLPPGNTLPEYDSSSHNLIPSGFSLVAVTARVPGRPIGKEESIAATIKNAIQLHYKELLRARPETHRSLNPVFYMSDIRLDSFMVEDNSNAVLLVDIEPRLRVV